MSTCDRHPGVKQNVLGCGRCGAPHCCPACCDEATADHEEHVRNAAVLRERDSLATQLEAAIEAVRKGER